MQQSVKPTAASILNWRAPAWSSLLWRLAALALGLFSSGAAALINQVVWQRSLKVFLGGSETISSMIVVLVFMAGLGVGSIWMGRRARRFGDPMFAFGMIEVLLFLANLGIRELLRSQLSDSVFAFQTTAISVGLPLPLLYGISSCGILAVPCLLMGATMPLAAEACQRRLGLINSKILGVVFFVNTIGSVAGALVASGYLIPHVGLSRSLLVAAALNLVGGVLVAALALASKPGPESQNDTAAENQPTGNRRSWFLPMSENILAFGLGFCSLGYEMFLLRLIPLRHQPLPFIFAAVLTGFLLFWSLGAAWSSRPAIQISGALRLCAFFCALTIPLFVFDSLRVMSDTRSIASFIASRFLYFVPCLFFGYLFGSVTAQAAKSWGADVGRIYAWNTLGSCLGVLGLTLVGYEMPFYLMVLVIALLLYALQEYADGGNRLPASIGGRAIPRWAYPFVGGILTTVLGLTLDWSGAIWSMRFYFGRDGVIGIDEAGNMVWDGLWHSQLSHDNNHVGTNNWYLAVCPVLCHPTGEIKDVCVVGVATGITASTLSKLETVERIDGYDITGTLKEIFSRYPEGTLHLADNPKIHLIWQDARSGLSLNATKYDVIQAQPLYLKQAGSALLNSVEFYHLVSHRLKPGGVFCLYSNGTPEQAFAIRQTAARVFPYRESFFNGYLLILSNDPFEITEETLAKKLNLDDPLWEEIRGWKETQDASAILRMLDRPQIPWGDGRLVNTDDHPIVEYPEYLSGQMRALGYDVYLPAPGVVLDGEKPIQNSATK